MPGAVARGATRGRGLRALGARSGDDAIAQTRPDGSLSATQSASAAEVSSASSKARRHASLDGDVPLGELRLVGLEHAEGVRADQRGDVVRNLGVVAHA